MAKIKICGMTRPEDIWAANRYKPDYIGFVFAKKSRRCLTVRQAAQLKRMLSGEILAVGVFVNAAKETVARLLYDQTIDIAQLHGQETEQDICWIKEQTGRPVIKAVSVQSALDIRRWQESSADYLLFDNGSGGTGCTFDWNLLAGCVKPFFLAGGIGPDNLEYALTKGAYAIDLSSAAETNGYKDPRKIAELIKIVHADEINKNKKIISTHEKYK